MISPRLLSLLQTTSTMLKIRNNCNCEFPIFTVIKIGPRWWFTIEVWIRGFRFCASLCEVYWQKSMGTLRRICSSADKKTDSKVSRPRWITSSLLILSLISRVQSWSWPKWNVNSHNLVTSIWSGALWQVLFHGTQQFKFLRAESLTRSVMFHLKCDVIK